MTTTPLSGVPSCLFLSRNATPQRVKSAWASTLRRSALHRVKLLTMADNWLQGEVWMVRVKSLMVQSFQDGEVGESHIPETEGTGVRGTATWENGSLLHCGGNAKLLVEKCSRHNRAHQPESVTTENANLMPGMDRPWVEPCAVAHKSRLG